jgi:hypothetical protein
MKRFAKLLALAWLGALAPAAAAQTDALTPVEPQVVAQAAKSCATALSPAGVDVKRLLADGWSEGKVTTKGKEVTSPVRFFGRAGAMLLLQSAPPKPSENCVVMARIASIGRYKQVAEATRVALSGRPVKSDKGSIVWLIQGGKAAQMDPTGSAKKPAIRLVVIQLSGKN